MKVYTPTNYPKTDLKFKGIFGASSPKIFLGGTIDMGNSEDWQSNLAKNLDELEGTIFNPRREDWDSSWKQLPTPGTPFYEQVDWELKAQANSDILIYVFLKDSKSPITLMEVGLFARADKPVFVVCPKEFYRYGNVRIVCEQFNLKFYHSIEEMMEVLKIHISEWHYEMGYQTVSKEQALELSKEADGNSDEGTGTS